MHALSKPIQALNRRLPLAASIAGLLAVSPAQAALTYTGDVSPATNPATWTSSTIAYIGNNTGDGFLNIDGGSSLSINKAYLGYAAGKTGTLSVDGAGSQLTSSTFYVGTSGNGALAITNGGAVSSFSTSVGNSAGSVGRVSVSGANSIWTSNSSGLLNIGNLGSGILTIANGGTVNSGATSGAVLGASTGSTGSASVDGPTSVWTIGNNLTVGSAGSGTLAITNGAKVTATSGTLGGTLTSKGNLSIDGAGSQWIGNSLSVGGAGIGKLDIGNGGSVNVTGLTNFGSLGTLAFGANGGTLNTGGLYAAGSQLSGAGTINTAGIVSDLNLIFDASHGAVQSFRLNGVSVNLNQTGANALGAGYLGSGSLLIADGVNIASNGGVLGSKAGANGRVIVTGADSKWTNGGVLTVGNGGKGSLGITDGAIVTNTSATLGNVAGSVGKVSVDGAGSQWLNSTSLTVGKNGTGMLSVSNGGTVSASSLAVNGSSLLTVDLDAGSALTIGGGSGTITNNGSIRLVAGADAASGSYTPMAYGTMSGTGSVQVLGGVWNGASHAVTVSDTAIAAAGESKTIDLSLNQRLLFTDAVSGDSVGLGFKGMTTPTSLTFSASEAGGSERSLLQSGLAAGKGVVSAWNFTPGVGYASGDPVYLSLAVGAGFKLSDLVVWHFDGSAWGQFAANDLAYDNRYVNFTVTGFSGYAVTAPVPVPAAVWLFGSALVGLGLVGRRKVAFAA